MEGPMNYTIKEAAEALGLSKRTLQRRIIAGELTAKLAQRGKQLVRVIDGVDLATFAQAEGYTLATPPPPEPVTIFDTGAPLSYDNPATPCPDCLAAKAAAAGQERLIAHLQAEVQFLREQVAALTIKALPGDRGGWWERLTGRRKA